jgi:hypothetical protein
MKTLPEGFVALLGHVKPLLMDDSVCAVVLEGTRAAWVEREGAPARPVDPLDETALLRLVDAVKVTAGTHAQAPLGARVPGQGVIHALEAPDIPGGWVLVLERQPTRSRPLHELVPADVLTVLTAMMQAGVGILVVGDHPEARDVVLHALGAAHPRAVRVVVAGSRPVPVGHTLQLQPADHSPAGMQRFFQGVVFARPDLLILPELPWGGLVALHAAARVGRVLGSCPGADAEAAVALLHAQTHGGLGLVAAAFRAVVEVTMTDRVTVRAVRELRGVSGGVVFHTTWLRHGIHLAGGWREAPAVSDRLDLPMAPPWPAAGSAPMHGGEGAALFGSPVLTGVTALMGDPDDGPIMDGPVELTSPIQAPAELRALTQDLDPPPDWEDATTRGQPMQVRRSQPLPVEDPSLDEPAPPLGTDVEQDIHAFKNTVSVPTVPRSARPPTAATALADAPFKDAPAFKESPSYRVRKGPPPPPPGPPVLGEKRSNPPPLAPPALPRRSDASKPLAQQRVGTRSGPKPVLDVNDVPGLEDVEGDTGSGVFVRARRDEEPKG